MILVIDNYDSFVHNVGRYFQVLGEDVRVARNDAVSVDAIAAMRPAAIVISPGPCSPTEAGVSCDVVARLSGEVPILGVCLGHQCLGTVFGGTVGRAARPMHGLASDITHDGEQLFSGLPNPLQVGRYHSLIVEPSAAMSEHLAIDARSEEGEIMALSHLTHPTYGVQFHPESVLTPSGAALFSNFLVLARKWAHARAPHAMADGTWHDGTHVPFDVADRGLLLGDGLFDTSLVLGRRMVWRPAHVERLVASAKVLGFVLDASRVEAAIDATLEQMTHGSLRLTVTRGAGPRGLAPPADARPTILATHAPLRASALFAPIKLHVTSIRRNETSPTSRIKSLNYLDGILATREAIAAGCDDTLFLNTRNRVTCTSVGNIFALIGDQLVTPPVDDGAVPGIARGALMAGCEDLGLEPVERSLTLDELDAADEVLVCNSLRLLAPVTAIGRKKRPSMRRSEALAAFLAHQVRGEVGIDPRPVAEG